MALHRADFREPFNCYNTAIRVADPLQNPSAVGGLVGAEPFANHVC